MRRKPRNTALKISAGLSVIVGAVMLSTMLPELYRYFRIRRM